MPAPDGAAALETVRRRASVLRALDRTAVRTSSLVARLDLSRSTVERALDELAEFDFVTRDEGGYRLTLVGELVAEEYERYAGRVDTLATSSDPLATLPAETVIPFDVLDGADVVTAEPHSPDLPVRALCDLLDAATSIRSFSPAVVAQQVQCYRRNVVDGDASADLVLTDPVLERLHTDFREELAAGLRSGRLRVRRLDAADAPPFSLVVCERPTGPAMGLLVYAESGVHGFVGNDDSAAVEWARTRLDGCWAAATALNRSGTAE